MPTFIKMLRDESGATAAEYALIVAVVGTAVALAAFGLAEALGSSMNTASNRISSCSGAIIC